MPDHLQGAALLDAVRSNGWSQLCFRLYSRDTAEVAAERIAAMIRPYVEKGIPVPPAPVEDSSGVYRSDGNNAAGIHLLDAFTRASPRASSPRRPKPG